MSVMNLDTVLLKTCFRCGIRFEIKNAAFFKRTVRNPTIADSCKDCYWIVKFEVWK